MSIDIVDIKRTVRFLPGALLEAVLSALKWGKARGLNFIEARLQSGDRSRDLISINGGDGNRAIPS